MTDRTRHLKAAFATARMCTRPVKPHLMFCSVQSNHQLWTVVETEYKFLNFISVTGMDPSAEDHDKWADLLAWMSAELAVWSIGSDPEFSQLRVLLLLTGCLDWDEVFWPELPGEIAANTSLLGALEDYIRTVKLDIRLLTRDNPITNSELIEGFNQADSAQDWVGVDEALPHIEIGFLDPMLRQSARLLRHFDFNRLISATNEIRQILVAGEIAEALAPEAALKLAMESTNFQQKFVCIYLTTHRRNIVLEPAAQQALTDLLVQTSADLDLWRKWLKVFNTYPVRFPGLQESLGAALAHVSFSAISSYIESLSLNTAPHEERGLITVCLQNFRSSADLKTRLALWVAAHKRWAEWDFARVTESPNLFKWSLSALDYAVVGYFVECADPADLKQEIEKILEQVNVVDRRWHLSLTDCISARNRLISRLQPLAHAHHVIATGDEWLTINKQYQITIPHGEAYFTSKYNIH